MNPYLSIVIPFYNEEGCVAAVLREAHDVLRASAIPFEIIAVQNGSLDRTAAVLAADVEPSEELHILDVPVNRGFGDGVLRGFACSRGAIIGCVPGDGQVDPRVLPEFVRRMERTGAQVGKGRRIVRRDGHVRDLLSGSFNAFSRRIFGLGCDDINGHPKLLTRHAYQAMALCSHDAFLDTEIMVKAQRLGFTVVELEVNWRARMAGRSNLRVGILIPLLRSLLVARFSKRDPWGIHSLPRASGTALGAVLRTEADEVLEKRRRSA